MIIIINLTEIEKVDLYKYMYLFQLRDNDDKQEHPILHLNCVYSDFGFLYAYLIKRIEDFVFAFSFYKTQGSSQFMIDDSKSINSFDF